MTAAFSDPQIEATFNSYPAPVRKPLLRLRDIIFATARETSGVGELLETLKWGQPAYLPVRPRTGTTIRIDSVKGSASRYAAYFHCQTTLVATFRELYPREFSFQGNRAIVLSADDELPLEAFKHCVAMALTYHRRPAS
ncbi:DUF1801 domain-containing protein [Microvirga sp. SM9]|nr:DUF1801 domain-containing protein [Microvirga lenta]